MSPRATRVIAALLMAPVAVGSVLYLPTPMLAGLVAALMMLGLWEWALLSGLNAMLPRACYLLANALLMLALVWAAGPNVPTLKLFPLELASVIGVVWWLFALLWLRNFGFAATDSPGARALKLLAGSLSVIPAWSALCWLHASQPLGPRWALFAVAIVWAADTGAYFVGVRFGKRKLAPRISPGKSWEGLYGGMAATLLFALAARSMLHVSYASLPLLLLLTLITGLISVAGDLFESLLKRHAGIKDSSDLIPGHGGVLDRLDSLLAALPVFLVAKIWLGL
jgi:phosphatidate cytidylyltransferase